MMNPFPSLPKLDLQEVLTSSEKDLIDKSKQDLTHLIQKNIDEIKEHFSRIASKTVQQLTHSFHKDILSQADSLLKLSIKPMELAQTKKVLKGLQNSIESLERLIFLARYFNPDNDEDFTKMLNPRANKLASMIYNLNSYILLWVSALLENIQLDPKDLLSILIDSKNKGIDTVSSDLLTTRLPSHVPEETNSLSTTLILDYYYLNSTFENINTFIEGFAKSRFPEKLRSMLESFSEDTSPSSPALLKLGESFTKANPVVLELSKELENLKKSHGGLKALNYLYDPKGNLDKSIQNMSQYEEEIKTAAEKYISQTFARHEDTKSDYEQIPVEKVDDAATQEIQNFGSTEKDKLRDFLKSWENEAKAEILRLLGRQKEMLQDHMSKYIEERLVTFQQGKGDFANVSFAKIVQEFCLSAKKEYKKILPVRSEQEYEVWPLYFCYVAENQYDFYLVEYMADTTALRVYLTATPMLSTLYKHLSKLDMQKIGKKNVLVSLLNYYDMDVNLEFRNVFRGGGESVEPEQIKQGKISQGLKDLIFITVFLLYNTPSSQPLSEIRFTSKDFAAFFNYTADFHVIYHQFMSNSQSGNAQGKGNAGSNNQNVSPNQSPMLRTPATFDFRAPFIDLKQQKNMFLIHFKGDVARENSVLIMRNMAQHYGDALQYKPLIIDEEMDRKDFMESEIAKYLKRSEAKQVYNFDGTEYLMTYLRKKKVQEGSIKFINKKQSQKLLDLFKAGPEGKATLMDLEDHSKFSRICLLFSSAWENSPGIMVSINRKANVISIYRHNKQNVEENDLVLSFSAFMGKVFGLDEGTTVVKQIRCIIMDETVLKYLKNHYFPYTCILDLVDEASLEGETIEVPLSMKHLTQAFKDFMSINLAENSLEAFKACNLVLEEKGNTSLKTINLGTVLKFNRLKSTLVALAEKVAQEKVQYILGSFNFVGAMGYKTYYIYFREMTGPSEDTDYSLPSPTMGGGRGRYIVDIFSLDYNLTQDDQEVLVIVAHICQSVSNPHLVLNAAYNVKARHNILLYNQVDLTLNTLGYLVHLGNIPIEKAFQKVSRSIVSHYEVIEGFLDQISIVTQAPSSFFIKQRSLSAPQNSSSFDMSSGKLMDPQGRLAGARANMLKKVVMLDSFFEDLAEQVKFRKSLEAQALSLLRKTDSKYFFEGIDIYAFIESLNLEDFPLPGVYSFAVDEQVMRKLLTNEGSVVRNVSNFLIEEVTASKEASEIKYPETQLFFLVSQVLFNSSKVLLITYNVERAESTFYYVRDSMDVDSQKKDFDDGEESPFHDRDNNILTKEDRKHTASRDNITQEQESETQAKDRGSYMLGEYDESRTSERSRDQSRNEDLSEQTSFYKKGRQSTKDFVVPESLRRLMESFNQTVAKNKKTKEKFRTKYFELFFDENISLILKNHYPLMIKFLIYYFSHQGLHQKLDRLDITPSIFNNFLCDYADRLFLGYIENSRIKENYKQLCNMFLEKNCPLGKRIALLAFLNGRAEVEQLNVIETCIKTFKQDFQKIYGIENAFFCFTINLKQSLRYFLLHLSGKAKKNLVLNIFTNGSSDGDGVIDKMIRTYCLEEGTTGGEDILIGKLRVFVLNMPNVLFTKYLEISTVLMANAVCNDVEDAVGYCADLAYSSVHYVKELKDFEDKCDRLGILQDLQRTNSQMSQLSQLSPS